MLTLTLTLNHVAITVTFKLHTEIFKSDNRQTMEKINSAEGPSRKKFVSIGGPNFRIRETFSNSLWSESPFLKIFQLHGLHFTFVLLVLATIVWGYRLEVSKFLSFNSFKILTALSCIHPKIFFFLNPIKLFLTPRKKIELQYT